MFIVIVPKKMLTFAADLVSPSVSARGKKLMTRWL